MEMWVAIGLLWVVMAGVLWKLTGYRRAIIKLQADVWNQGGVIDTMTAPQEPLRRVK